MTAVAAIEVVSSTKAACRLLGVSRATLYRSRRAPVHGPRRAPGGGLQPAALSADERERVLQVLNSDRFADKSPEQVWAVCLDEGVYLGSVSTLYRVLRSAAQVRERRAQARHPPRVRPELIATGVNRVWSWDITKLKGPLRGTYFDAYVIMDIYSRKVLHWEVNATENGPLAADFISAAVGCNGGIGPVTIHSDNGTSMTSKTVAGLLADLKIERSLSRPHTSNDNPFSEAAFKTLKYCPAFPDIFVDLHHARQFAGVFFRYYNTEHRHSGIGLYTPSSVHDGTWVQARDARQDVLDTAWKAHPERFACGRPHAPKLPESVWINQPPTSIESGDLHTTARS